MAESLEPMTESDYDPITGEWINERVFYPGDKPVGAVDRRSLSDDVRRAEQAREEGVVLLGDPIPEG